MVTAHAALNEAFLNNLAAEVLRLTRGGVKAAESAFADGMHRLRELIGVGRAERAERAARSAAPSLAGRLARSPKQAERSFLEVLRGIYSELGDPSDAASGLQVLLVLFVTSVLALQVLTALVGSFTAQLLSALVLAPIMEEYARRVLIQRGSGLSTFTFGINAIEFVGYVVKMTDMGIGLGVAVVFRLIAAFAHELLGAYQRWGFERDVQNGVDAADAGAREFRTAVVIHAAFNAFNAFIVGPALVAEGAVLVGDEIFFA